MPSAYDVVWVSRWRPNSVQCCLGRLFGQHPAPIYRNIAISALTVCLVIFYDMYGRIHLHDLFSPTYIGHKLQLLVFPTFRSFIISKLWLISPIETACLRRLRHGSVEVIRHMLALIATKGTRSFDSDLELKLIGK